LFSVWPKSLGSRTVYKYRSLGGGRERARAGISRSYWAHHILSSARGSDWTWLPVEERKCCFSSIARSQPTVWTV